MRFQISVFFFFFLRCWWCEIQSKGKKRTHFFRSVKRERQREHNKEWGKKRERKKMDGGDQPAQRDVLPDFKTMSISCKKSFFFFLFSFFFFLFFCFSVSLARDWLFRLENGRVLCVVDSAAKSLRLLFDKKKKKREKKKKKKKKKKK